LQTDHQFYKEKQKTNKQTKTGKYIKQLITIYLLLRLEFIPNKHSVEVMAMLRKFLLLADIFDGKWDCQTES
jgi:hypothetical protein